MSIPKIIHYCWFGGNEKPKKVNKCIESWKKFMPEFEIIEWNESNFDINALQYTKQAYEMKKYAFVSDVARLNALNTYGGIYFDTDVEVFKNFTPLLNEKCILGFEEEEYIATSMMAAEPNNTLINRFLKIYDNIPFLDEEGNIIEGTNVSKLTDLLVEKGLKRENIYQKLDDNISIYPKEYFSPYVYPYGIYQITDNSYCVHHFFVSWQSKTVLLRRYLKMVIAKLIGLDNTKKIRKLFVKEN